MFDYVKFEAKFRSRGEAQVEDYKGYLGFIPKSGLLVDLGCGRGDFLEFASIHREETVGFEINPEFVALCRKKGLNVHHKDLFEALEGFEDDSLAAVFLSHVIEHLTSDDAWRVMTLAYKKLKNAGVFIAETPNPQCLLIFAESFYMDPTHVRPVHPLTLQFVAEQIGFKELHFHYSSDASDFRLPRLKAKRGCIENLEEFNAAVDKVNSVLFGYRNVALIAGK